MSGRVSESDSAPSGLPGLRSAAGPAARRGEPAGLAPVSHETLAQPKRRYVSGARRRKAERTREALLDAAVALIGEGYFRPEASAIAARAGVHKSAINRHFSAIHLLHRVVARERAGAVLEALGIVTIRDDVHVFDYARTAALQADLVWIALTGRRRDGWA